MQLITAMAKEQWSEDVSQAFRCIFSRFTSEKKNPSGIVRNGDGEFWMCFFVIKSIGISFYGRY